MRQMNAKELAALVSDGESPLMIDVREENELSNGVIEGAVHIPMQHIPDQLVEFSQNREQTIVIVCRSGKRSDHVGQFMEQNGFTDVINLAGGMNSWATDVDSSMTVY